MRCWTKNLHGPVRGTFEHQHFESFYHIRNRAFDRFCHRRLHEDELQQATVVHTQTEIGVSTRPKLRRWRQSEVWRTKPSKMQVYSSGRDDQRLRLGNHGALLCRSHRTLVHEASEHGCVKHRTSQQKQSGRAGGPWRRRRCPSTLGLRCTLWVQPILSVVKYGTMDKVMW